VFWEIQRDRKGKQNGWDTRTLYVVQVSDLCLCIAAMTGINANASENIKEAMENCNTKQVKEWKANNICKTLFAEKRELNNKIERISGYIMWHFLHPTQNHIEQANDNLISKRKGKWSYLLGTLGGIFLGTAASNTFGMLVLNTTYTVGGITTTIVIGMIGAFLIAINLNNNWLIKT